MTRVLVTGTAGFIGSRIAGELLTDGCRVTGVDAFTDYYDPQMKRDNVASLCGHSGFEFIEADLCQLDLRAIIADVDAVVHQAAQPGVRASWGDDFAVYCRRNIEATQALLEAARGSKISRFVYASSSSVYGDAPRYPTFEDGACNPRSPYGITKLAAEGLCNVYAANFGVPTVSLRYFTVYGPGQRPDMAMHRLIEAALRGESFPLYGDGEQIRDFTYVFDVVRANCLAVERDLPPGTVMNIGGGSSATLRSVIELIGELTRCDIQLDRRPQSAGDVARTGAAIDRAQQLLEWAPMVDVATGLREQVAWHLARTSVPVAAP
ncbi:MAG TPA: NAD-dependent epimerase/dehydratase family protein [Acidimicrobiales bacterium]|nr:NAD-dependent epimerase/dehydratase family protein [Acidimicrobiales bacterium]